MSIHEQLDARCRFLRPCLPLFTLVAPSVLYFRYGTLSRSRQLASLDQPNPPYTSLMLFATRSLLMVRAACWTSSIAVNWFWDSPGGDLEEFLLVAPPKYFATEFQGTSTAQEARNSCLQLWQIRLLKTLIYGSSRFASYDWRDWSETRSERVTQLEFFSSSLAVFATTQSFV